MAYLRGLLSPAERQNSWQVADSSGEATPSAVQHLRRRALWNPDAGRDVLRRDVIPHLGALNGVLVIAEVGLLKQGQPSAGGARQASGTAGTVENGQMGVCLGSVRPLGHALLARER